MNMRGILNKIENLELAQENESLKKNMSRLKQDHQKQVSKLKKRLQEALLKVDHFEELLRGESRLDSATEDITRSFSESKSGESTLESDRLFNMLKDKEDNIRKLIEKLKVINSKESETAKSESQKYDTMNSDTSRGKCLPTFLENFSGDSHSSSRKNRHINEQTPEFHGPRGISLESLRQIESLMMANNGDNEKD